MRVELSPVTSPRQNGEFEDEREQHGQLDEEALHDLHARVGVGHRDVDVHAEDELAARDVLQLLDEPAVAVAARDALLLRE